MYAILFCHVFSRIREYLLHRPPRILVLSIQAGTLASCVSHLDVIFNCYVQRAACVLQVGVSAKRRPPRRFFNGTTTRVAGIPGEWGMTVRKQHRSRRGHLLPIFY